MLWARWIDVCRNESCKSAIANGRRTGWEYEMPYAYHISEEHGVAVIRPYGRFNEMEFIEVLRAVYGHPRRTPEFSHVWDARSIDELTMDTDVIPMYKSFLDEQGDAVKDVRIAIIASRSTIRLFSAMLSEINDQRAQQAVRQFPGEHAVSNWLGIPVESLRDIPQEAWTPSPPPTGYP